MIVKSVEVGNRSMLVVGDIVIPIDCIKCFDLDPANGGCSNSVRIVTDNLDDDLIWVYEDANSIRMYLNLDPKEDY